MKLFTLARRVPSQVPEDDHSINALLWFHTLPYRRHAPPATINNCRLRSLPSTLHRHGTRDGTVILMVEAVEWSVSSPMVEGGK